MVSSSVNCTSATAARIGAELSFISDTLTEGGSWSASDFSPDGTRLLVSRYVSANESHPGELELASGKLAMFPVDGGKAALGQFRYAPDGKGVFYISDEDIAGKPQQFRTLRWHGPGMGAPKLRVSSGACIITCPNCL